MVRQGNRGVMIRFEVQEDLLKIGSSKFLLCEPEDWERGSEVKR